MAFLENLMKNLLDFLYYYTKSYGLSIIILTVIIKIVLLPFSFQQFKSLKKMQEIAPEQKKLQEKYKNDPQKLNKELMELYKKHGYNPMGGCLPLLIQFPFIIALFSLLQHYNFGNTGFLWLYNLGAPDKTYILPILAALTTYLSSRMTTPGKVDQQQNTMNIVMSGFIGWMALKFPSGLALYWVVSNIIQIVQQLIIVRPTASKGEGAK